MSCNGEEEKGWNGRRGQCVWNTAEGNLLQSPQSITGTKSCARASQPVLEPRLWAQSNPKLFRTTPKCVMSRYDTASNWMANSGAKSLEWGWALFIWRWRTRLSPHWKLHKHFGCSAKPSAVQSLIANTAPPPGAIWRHAPWTLLKRALAVIMCFLTPYQAQRLYTSHAVICILMVMDWVETTWDRYDIPVIISL